MGRQSICVHQFLTVVLSTVIISLTLFILLYEIQYTDLKRLGLKNRSKLVDNFIHTICISYTSSLLIAVIFIFIRYPVFNVISIFFFTILFLGYISSFIIVFAFRNKVIDSYSYIFSSNMSEIGEKFQQEQKCCGWTNVSEPIYTYPECAFDIPCRNVISHFYYEDSIYLSLCLGTGILIFAYTIYASFRIFRIHQHPFVPDYEQRLNSVSKMDDLIF